ncbi:MAG: protein kinase, partial [Candidatus Rokubacteria bacterium]|nr:protein kinase [Candidatus Rokubacteria bacterium]
GVVHHDLKPGNLRMTTDGRLKILDFGLAKWLQPAVDLKTTDKLSDTGSGAGTLPYMAPEQLKKDEADPRSDIYAAGAVLYEMATGRRPFPQTSPPRLIEAILNQTPPGPGALNPRISAALESIVVKAMDKDPGRRYQTARELQVDLERLGIQGTPLAARRRPVPRSRMLSGRRFLILVGGALPVLFGLLVALDVGGLRGRWPLGATRGRIESLAVLPLTNLSGDPEQEYFAEGMTEEIITNLAQIRSLRVISRTSTTRYKGTHKTLPEIARELSVDAVVEGTVLRSGQRLRLTAQLVEATTDRHLWAGSYESDLQDVLVLQANLARALAHEIQSNLAPQDQARFANARPVNPEAYEAFLSGRHFANQLSGDGLMRGLEYTERAIRISPDYATGYAAMAVYYVELGRREFLPPKEAFTKARTLALRALKLDDTLAGAHMAMGNVLYEFDWDWSGAERELLRALELNPGFAPARMNYVYWLETMGRVDEAIVEAGRAREIDPLSLPANLTLADSLYLARRYDQAITRVRETLDLHPDAERAHAALAKCYAERGTFGEAVAEAREALRLSNDSAENRALLGYILARAGRKAEARRILDELHELSRRRYVARTELAVIHAALGDKERPFALLEEAYEQRDPWLTYLVVDPVFDPLRPDSRFRDLVRRMGLPLD